MNHFLYSYQFLSIIGLTIDIIGVVILFYTGLPFKLPDRDLYVEEFITDKQNRKDKRQQRFAYLGLSLLIVGFSIQIISSAFSYFS